MIGSASKPPTWMLRSTVRQRMRCGRASSGKAFIAVSPTKPSKATDCCQTPSARWPTAASIAACGTGGMLGAACCITSSIKVCHRAGQLFRLAVA